ncbi:ParB N-terminal domain-containing protein [Bacillus cereus]|uniref:ParB-like N-terminal domain-containing protein n=1 Tax=Bacillus cereus HuA3-9 TaxID=1053205 RepID=R8CX72_BACCE|nr:ParB N-terminal domain-containing protein [Bacillus cereus]EOO16140.1 hypothetical protein IGA_03670 [Bacillus cereus HuA3-9]
MLTELKVIPANQIFLHEEFELGRLKKICKKIKSEQQLKNPPIALQLEEDKYLILDGAHRTLSLKELNCKRIVVQVVKTDQLSISSWTHHLLDSKKILQELDDNPNVYFSDKLEEYSPIAVVYFNDTEKYLYVHKEKNIKLESKIEVWKEIVNIYTNKCPCSRLPDNELLPVHGIALSYSTLDLGQIKQIVKSNLLLPAGVTKFNLKSGRILNLNIPLSFLIREDFIEEDWKELLELWESSIRLYTDPVLLCEL